MSDRVRIISIGSMTIVTILAMLLLPTDKSLIWTLTGGLFAVIGVPFIVRAYQLEQKLTELTALLKKEKEK